jgi:hypothetical protein
MGASNIFTEAFRGTRVVGKPPRKTTIMKITTLAALFCLYASLAVGEERDVNDLPRPEFHGMTQKQVTTLIFSQENRMIDKLSSLRPVTEAYVQSLGQQKSMGMDLSDSENSESVIDDVYFLARVNFTDGGPEEKLLVGGGSWRNRYVKINSGALDQVHPLGMLMMFFADLHEFDADTYSLQYQGKQSLFRTECLVFSVAPIQEHNSGKFRGQLWVDSSSFSIVRLKGVFSGPYKRFFKSFTGPERFFHFDSVREKTEVGWLPSSTYFDERHVYARDGDLEFHYRGYVLMWEQGRQLQSTQSSIPNRAKSLSGEQNRDGGASLRLVSALESDGLLAAPGPVERHLEDVVAHLRPPESAGMPEIHCRVLLSTPAEAFALGNTIIVSRGLLNLVPDDSVLAFLLARQLAHILLRHGTDALPQAPESFFDDGKKEHSGRLNIRLRPEQEAAADAEAMVLLQASPYKGAGVSARALLSRLNSGSERFRHLLRAEFGTGLLPEGIALAKDGERAGSHVQAVLFRNRYRVCWSRLIVDSEQPAAGTEVTIFPRPVASATSNAE